MDRNNTAKDMQLAELIYKNLPNYTGLKGRGIKKENWYVINQNKIPAVLVEGGFMDSNIDYKVITSESGQNGYAKAVAEGLIEFLGLKKSEFTPVETTNIGYLVKVTTNVLNVRSEAGTNNSIRTQVKKGEIYTIVEEKMNGNTKWGKLKSGAGWISLDYAEKITYKSNEEFYSIPNYSGNSIVAALQSIGVDSSFNNRKNIATKNKIYNYVGTATQNRQLLDKLKAGKLLK